LPRICQRETCGHKLKPNKRGIIPRFCTEATCPGLACQCLKLDKRERVAEKRARDTANPRKNKCLGCPRRLALQFLTQLIALGRRWPRRPRKPVRRGKRGRR